MREWVRKVFVEGPLPKYRDTFEIPLRRPKQDIVKEILSIPCSDGKSNLDLWLNQPLLVNPKTTTARPVILMFHGGGWIHGDPSADDGQFGKRMRGDIVCYG